LRHNRLPVTAQHQVNRQLTTVSYCAQIINMMLQKIETVIHNHSFPTDAGWMN